MPIHHSKSVLLEKSIIFGGKTYQTRLTYNCAHLRSTKESLTFEYDICWYWVSRRRYWLVLGGTRSVWGRNGWYLVVLGQSGRYWLIHDGTGSV